MREVATALFTEYVNQSSEAERAESRSPAVDGSEHDNVDTWLRAFHEWGARVSTEHPGGGFVAQLQSDRR